MHVIPIAGCDLTSLCRFCLVLVLVVCFSCFCCVVFGLLFCFLVLLLGQFLDCVLVHNRHFCGFRQGDSPACKLQFNCLPRMNMCNDLAEAMKALDGKKWCFLVVLFLFCLWVFVVGLLFCLFLPVCFCGLFCVFGFLAGTAYWTAYRSTTSTFVAIDKLTAVHDNYNSSFATIERV